MGFWGKAIGIGFGFMIGGPLGAILGGALGHMYDVESQSPAGLKRLRCPHCHNTVPITGDGHCPVCGMQFSGASAKTSTYDRQFIFYLSLASLAAKMAKADGVVTEDEVRAFDHFVRVDLRLNTEERKIVANLFNEAKASPEDGLAIARQFKDLVGFQRELLHTMVHLLFRISMADGKFHQAEERYINQVAQIFGLSSMEYEQIKALFIKKTDRAYQVLGVTPQASDTEIKEAYKKLVREYHPDKLVSKGLPEDFMKIAHEKMSEINAAYDQIKKERRI